MRISRLAAGCLLTIAVATPTPAMSIESARTVSARNGRLCTMGKERTKGAIFHARLVLASDLAGAPSRDSVRSLGKIWSAMLSFERRKGGLVGTVTKHARTLFDKWHEMRVHHLGRAEDTLKNKEHVATFLELAGSHVRFEEGVPEQSRDTMPAWRDKMEPLMGHSAVRWMRWHLDRKTQRAILKAMKKTLDGMELDRWLEGTAAVRPDVQTIRALRAEIHTANNW